MPPLRRGLMTMLLAHPGFYAMVAERAPIAGFTPTTVDPAVQGSGIGRLLMRNVLDHAARGFADFRLLQAAYNIRRWRLGAVLAPGLHRRS